MPLFNIYGPTGNRKGCEELLRVALECAENLGRIATIISGDFNFDLMDTCLESTMAWAGWINLIDLVNF